MAWHVAGLTLDQYCLAQLKLDIKKQFQKKLDKSFSGFNTQKFFLPV